MAEEGALRTLETLKIRVGRLASLNDPFDCAPHILGADAREAIIAKHIVAEIFRFRGEQVGVICFSRTWSNPVLWSHYADSHRGIALVLRQPDGPSLWRIRYEKECLVIRYSDLQDDTKRDKMNRAVLESFKIKSPTWRYERETRIVSELETCEAFAGHYFTPLPKAAIVGVILGLRCTCTPEYVRRVFRNHGLSKAKVWRTIKSDSGFTLERKEV